MAETCWDQIMMMSWSGHACPHSTCRLPISHLPPVLLQMFASLRVLELQNTFTWPTSHRAAKMLPTRIDRICVQASPVFTLHQCGLTFELFGQLEFQGFSEPVFTSSWVCNFASFLGRSLIMGNRYQLNLTSSSYLVLFAHEICLWPGADVFCPFGKHSAMPHKSKWDDRGYRDVTWK